MNSQVLSGRRILLTRTEAQNEELAALVHARGGVPVVFPCLRLEAMPEAIETGLAMLPEYDDLLFTSVNGVESVAAFLAAHGDNLASRLAGKRVAAVGGRTASALLAHGVHVALVPELASQDGLIALYSQAGMPRRGLLFFRAEEGRESLVKALSLKHVNVAMIPAYRTVCPDVDAGDVQLMLAQNEIDAVLLGSPKAASHYLQRVGSLALANAPVIVVISEKMAQSAAAMGLQVQLVAQSASFESMLDALAACYADPS